MAAWASAQARNVLPTPVGPVEPPGAAQVEILDDRVAAETGGLEVACKPAVVAVLHLPVDEQAEALLEAEGGVVGTLELVDERAGHAGQGEGVQLVDRRCDEHARISSSLVVAGATHVGVVADGGDRLGAGQGQAVEPV